MGRTAGQVETLREQVKGLGKPEELTPGQVGRLRTAPRADAEGADGSIGEAPPRREEGG